MSQINSIAGNLQAVFRVPPVATGIVLALLTGRVILGGLKRVAAVTEAIVPLMALFYLFGALTVVCVHWAAVPAAFAAIFRGAFGLQAAGGGVLGYGMARAISWGFKRGAFSNEAMKKFLHIPVSVEMASEFMYTDPVVDEKTLVIAVSQSGETIDTLEALKYAKQKGAGSLAVINVKGSSIARESDAVLYTNAGPEIAVASTKAYTSQLALFALLVARMAYVRGDFTETETRDFVRELKRVPDAMEKVLAGKEKIHHIAGRIISAKDIFMIGRGLDYFIAMEGSLKLKEVSYIHSEAYASGELKHGPLALITEHTPVVAVATQKQLLSKEVSNIREVRSRGADVVLFAKEQLMPEEEEGYLTFELPDVRDEFMCLPAAAALQLLAYYVSSDKGYDVRF